MTDVLEGAHIAGCRIESVAGRGGMGIVYRATQLSLGRPVALKLIAPEHAADAGFRERFQRESRMAAAIDHPNVIPVYEAGEEDGRLYITMRWVEGTDLHRLLRSEGRIDPLRAAKIVDQVAGALDAAHEAGLIHRDVKPANVLLSGDHAYLADFGLTRFAGADTMTTGGHFLGTVDYMAPEQFHPGPNDARADVYALGCVLFAALTGAPPFLRETVPATMLAHLHDKPPRASLTEGVSPGFDRVLARALAKSPEDRYPSAGDFGRAALAAAEGRSVTAEERSVARGAAAPTIRRDGRLWSGPHEPLPDPVDEDARPTQAEEAPVRTYRARRTRRRALAWASGVGAIAAGVVALGVVPGGADTPEPGAPVSSGDVERMAKSFASAYGDEDAPRISRLLTSDAQRTSPTDSQVGRRTVVAAYESQFNDNAITGMELDGLSGEGGASGRATAKYKISYKGAKPTTGQMTWIVIRDKGRPRISLIAFRPD
ncbi:serine/threonine-protein kinase [Solirubrobacter soli]|uniref:serine/threonine-protein kinase n=1 Tax=Solirubrobacter soli TaxID=363832 RepID=UPI0004075DAE|nr:serine/threonine-protein kinase [Solirubrobacter soli]